jgi:glycosyltransferase involved in cell wall biosynthesis
MNSVKSIAIVDPVGAKAGMDWYDLQLLEAFSEIGWHAYLFSNIKHANEPFEVFNVFNNAKDRGLKSLLKILKGLFLSQKFIRKKRIRIVVLHVFRSDWLELLFSYVFYQSGVKVCLIIHDIKSLDTSQNAFMRQFLLSHFHHYKVVHNEYSRTELIKAMGKKEDNSIYVIPHGDFTRMIEKLRDDSGVVTLNPYSSVAINLLFFGQVKKVKGLDILLEAMTMLDDSFKLTIAGKSRDDSMKNYSEIITRLQKKGSLEIISRHVTDSERDFLMRNCDAVILPYRQIYQSGVLLMAMSYGKSVIASDLPAFSEIIDDGHNGLLFERNNPVSLASAIKRLKTIDLKKTGLAAKTEVMKKYNWNNVVLLYIKMFENHSG